jgi:cytochrome c oxidase cbb3-type subunit 3
MRNKLKYIGVGLFTLLIGSVQPVWAAGPPSPSIFNNPLAVTFIVMMILLLIIIGVLSNILLGAAEVKLKKSKVAGAAKMIVTLSFLGLLLSSGNTAFAQAATATADAAAPVAPKMIGGMSASTFYVLSTVLFLELFIIIALLVNIQLLLKNEKEKLATAAEKAVDKLNHLSWWDRFNKLRPVSQEADIDLGHDYDGIRELDNRLPPWWLYGFYACIIFAGIYLWRFHISHTGPSSKQEYERSVARAEADIQEYLKQKGESVDENTVTILTDAADLDAGKGIFLKSCVTCHKATGAGDVGPNLTDDYWLHGNKIGDLFKTIRYGFNAMPQWQNQYSNKQIAQVASYVKSLHGTNPPGAKAPQGTLMTEEAQKVPAKDSAAAEAKKIAMN